ncbi:MAG: transcription-repair coupling factor [Proteobacteria bacterium]|nr:transcription-repair coupling factor [Pseudomonadota bacterium]
MYQLDKNGFIYITGKIGSFVSFLLSNTHRKTLLFYDTEDEALLLKEEMEFFAGKEVHLFPVYSDRVFEKEDETKRISFLYHLAADDTFTGIFPNSAITHPLTAQSSILAHTKDLSFGDTVFQEELISYLDGNGYEMASLVREEGEYAKRGSIIDIFPPSSDKPVRIEFLGDQIFSLRIFNPVTQRSHEEIERLSITPAKILKDENVTLLDYLKEGMIFVHKGIDSIFRTIQDDSRTSCHMEIMKAIFHSSLNIDISGIQGEEEGEVIEAVSNEDLKHLFETNKTGIFTTFSDKIKGDWKNCKFIYIFANNLRQGERMQEILKNYDIALPIIHKTATSGKEREWAIVIGPLRRGFRADNIIVLTEEDIVGPKKRAVKQKWDGLDDLLNSFKDLNVGEWVVHIDHGIGIYKGIVKLMIDGSEKDFILIEYQDGDKLYVPIDDLRLVQKFMGGEKHKPKIDKLGSQYWKNTKSRVKKHIEDIAKDLIKIYAEREMAEGYAYPPEDEAFREMESRFEYEETEGQSEAIEKVLDDLKSTKPMDRLICGDVGFGKTEVALRASFKAVMDSKQVALLVPTTILAQQHFKNFTDRYRDYPINIEMLSRFRTKEEQKKIVEAVKKGSIDLIIGTHRLLQKDLAFKDLGLLIIDEEHRFGVKHKEALKQIKKNIDVLTLSATPIPRTLYMATTGIRDLSIINTPPLDRLAVKTFVIKSRDETIKKGITNELNRSGQVFFVHNYIHNIGIVYEHLAGLLPDAKIAVAHGRMEGKQLEKIMLDFIDKKYDILLSTNIIESGLDISNVNTIFINNAHRMGLADLYQLRGRVGRSTKQAYAYLLVPKDEILNKDATLRLKIIEELTDLGSGFHIANYDLEIRGAGNLLGKEQSGSINLIGFELYCNMLENAVNELKNETETKEEEVITEINIPIDAFIPDSYVEDPAQKLLIYKRLSKIKEPGELVEMEEELKDRYGEIPGPLNNLLKIISLKIFLTDLKIKKLEYSAKRIIIHVTEGTPLNMEKILRFIQKGQSGLKLLPDGKIIVPTDKKTEDLINLARNILKEIISI